MLIAPREEGRRVREIAQIVWVQLNPGTNRERTLYR